MTGSTKTSRDPIEDEEGYFGGDIRAGHVRKKTHSVSQLVLFEVTEAEFDVLEKGNDGGLYFNILVGSAMLFVSMLVTLFMSEPGITGRWAIFSAIGLGLGGSIVATLAWMRSEETVKKVCERIRARSANDADGAATKEKAPAKRSKSKTKRSFSKKPKNS